MSVEAPRSPERERASYTELPGLQARLALGSDALDPANTSLPEVTEDQLKNADLTASTDIITRASQQERRDFWKEREEQTFDEQKEAWKRQITDLFQNNKSFFADNPEGQRWTQLFKDLGIENAADFTDEMSDDLYKAFFSGENTASDIALFQDNIIRHYTDSSNLFNYGEMKKDLPAIEWIASIFGKEYANEIVINLVDLEGKRMSDKLSDLVNQVNTKTGDTTRLNVIAEDASDPKVKREWELVNHLSQFKVEVADTSEQPADEYETFLDEIRDVFQPMSHIDEISNRLQPHLERLATAASMPDRIHELGQTASQLSELLREIDEKGNEVAVLKDRMNSLNTKVADELRRLSEGQNEGKDSAGDDSGNPDIGETEKSAADPEEDEVESKRSEPGELIDTFLSEHPRAGVYPEDAFSHMTSQYMRKVNVREGDTIVEREKPLDIHHYHNTEVQVSAVERPDGKAEDSFVISIDEEKVNVVVADGVTNTASGKVASRLVTSVILEELPLHEPSHTLVEAANNALQDQSVKQIVQDTINKRWKEFSAREVKTEYNLRSIENDQEMFDNGDITAAMITVAQYDRKTGKLAYVLKGDTQIILLRHTGESEIIEGPESSLFTATENKSPDLSDTLEGELELQPEDVVLIQSDGLGESDAVRDQVREFLNTYSGFERLDIAVSEFIRQEIERTDPDDDVTTVIIAHNNISGEKQEERVESSAPAESQVDEAAVQQEAPAPAPEETPTAALVREEEPLQEEMQSSVEAPVQDETEFDQLVAKYPDLKKEYRDELQKIGDLLRQEMTNSEKHALIRGAQLLAEKHLKELEKEQLLDDVEEHIESVRHLHHELLVLQASYEEVEDNDPEESNEDADTTVKASETALRTSRLLNEVSSANRRTFSEVLSSVDETTTPEEYVETLNELARQVEEKQLELVKNKDPESLHQNVVLGAFLVVVNKEYDTFWDMIHAPQEEDGQDEFQDNYQINNFEYDEDSFGQQPGGKGKNRQSNGKNKRAWREARQAKEWRE